MKTNKIYEWKWEQIYKMIWWDNWPLTWPDYRAWTPAPWLMAPPTCPPRESSRTSSSETQCRCPAWTERWSCSTKRSTINLFIHCLQKNNHPCSFYFPPPPPQHQCKHFCILLKFLITIFNKNTKVSWEVKDRFWMV